MKRMRNALIGAAAQAGLAWALLPAAAMAQDATSAMKAEIEALRKEVQDVKEASARPPYEWDKSTSFHLGGYAAVGYSSQKTGGRSFDQAVFVPGFHFNYRDIVFAEAKFETAVAPNGETETKLESANLNFFLGNYAALVVGKYLSPLGQFQQNYHAPWINKLASRPVGFGEEVSGAPLASVGAQVRGGFPLGMGMKANYAVFVANAPALRPNGAGDEIELITNEPGTSAPNDLMIYGGRASLFPLPTLEIGVSAATGKTALEDAGAVGAERSYQASGFDFTWQFGKNFDLRGEYLRQRVGSGDEDPAGPFAAVASTGATWTARYIQGAYKFLPKWEGVVRWGEFEAPHSDQRQEQTAVGLNYWWASNVIGKITYEWNSGDTGQLTDENRLLLQATYGF